MNNIQYFARREILNPLRADLWRIETGMVRATAWLCDGSLTTLGFWGAGETIGSALFRSETYELECLTAVRASPLIAGTHPDLVMGSHIQQLQELLIIRSHKRIEDMLLQLLTWLGDRFGNWEETGIKLRFPLTHQDLAETLSTTRVTITRSLRQLENRGLICRLPKCQMLIVRGASPVENRSADVVDSAPRRLFECLPPAADLDLQVLNRQLSASSSRS